MIRQFTLLLLVAVLVLAKAETRASTAQLFTNGLDAFGAPQIENKKSLSYEVAGVAVISGQVLNDLGEPILNTRVVAYQNDELVKVVRTDTSGHYTLRLNPGTYNLDFRDVQYPIHRVAALDVKSGEELTINARLFIYRKKSKNPNAEPKKYFLLGGEEHQEKLDIVAEYWARQAKIKARKERRKKKAKKKMKAIPSNAQAVID